VEGARGCPKLTRPPSGLFIWRYLFTGRDTCSSVQN